MKVLCLGNEFIEEDSFAKEVGSRMGRDNFEIVNIKDSFELLNYVNGERGVVILDVVSGFKDVKELSLDDLKDSKIITAHDFDAGFFLKLLANKGVKIIGIPMVGDVEKISSEVKELLP